MNEKQLRKRLRSLRWAMFKRAEKRKNGKDSDFYEEDGVWLLDLLYKKWPRDETTGQLLTKLGGDTYAPHLALADILYALSHDLFDDFGIGKREWALSCRGSQLFQSAIQAGAKLGMHGHAGTPYDPDSPLCIVPDLPN
jgi:hypothetical protein